MYKLEATIRGTSPILQNKYALEVLNEQMDGASRKSGAIDYSLQWLDKMYVTSDGLLYQPASHIEGCLAEAGKLFTIKGRKGKTYRDLFRAYCYVLPDEIYHLDEYNNPVLAPDKGLMSNPTDRMSVLVSRVKIQRAAVPRLRLQISAGWRLSFVMEIHDEQLRQDVVETVLCEAGRAVGIGDYRPRYGRFDVERLERVGL